MFAPSGYSYPTDSMIAVYDNRFTITFTNSTTALVWAYTSSSTDATLIFHYHFTMFVNTPQVRLTPRLSKILVLGPWDNPDNNNITEAHIEGFYVDHANNAYYNMTTPVEIEISPQNTYFRLGEQFGYLRQLSGTHTNTSIPLQEMVYFFAQETIAVPIFVRNLTSDNTI